MSIEPATPTPLKWSKVHITFSRKDQWTSFSELGRFPLVLDLVVVGSRLTKVLIDGGSGLNVLFAKTLKKMSLNIIEMLTPNKLSILWDRPRQRVHTPGTSYPTSHF